MVWPVACPQTDIQTDKKAKTEESEFLPSAHNQGEVQRIARLMNPFKIERVGTVYLTNLKHREVGLWKLKQ